MKYNDMQQILFCKMYKQSLLGIALAISALGMSGCSSVLNVADNAEFSCPGMPGVMCKTPQQVYKSTNKALPGERFNTGAAAPVPGAMAAITEGQMPHVVQQPFMLQPITGAPVPIREPSRVMRIWIGPWIESKTDNLHWPTYIYTEVQPRKWTIGDPDFKTLRAGMPLTVRPSVAQTPVQSGPQSVEGVAPRAAPQPQSDSAESSNNTQPYE